jgi:hypothetical protein
MDKDNKKSGVMIMFGGKEPKDGDKEYKKEEDSGKESKLQYTLEDWGGYTPMELVSKLEEAKDALSKGNAKEAIMALDNCIVRISGKQLPENNEDDSAIKSNPFYELEKQLS